MIEETAIVVKADGHTVWLESVGNHGCGQCQNKSGCGQVFSQLFGVKASRFKAESDQLLKEGDKVLLGLDETALIRGSMLVYLLPILAMIILAAVAAAGSTFFNIAHEGFVIVAGLFGFYAAFRYARKKAHKLSNSKSFQPVILKNL